MQSFFPTQDCTLWLILTSIWVYAYIKIMKIKSFDLSFHFQLGGIKNLPFRKVRLCTDHTLIGVAMAYYFLFVFFLASTLISVFLSFQLLLRIKMVFAIPEHRFKPIHRWFAPPIFSHATWNSLVFPHFCALKAQYCQCNFLNTFS